MIGSISSTQTQTVQTTQTQPPPPTRRLEDDGARGVSPNEGRNLSTQRNNTLNILA